MKGIARAITFWLVFGLIMWFGIAVMPRPQNTDVGALFGLIVLGSQSGAPC